MFLFTPRNLALAMVLFFGLFKDINASPIPSTGLKKRQDPSDTSEQGGLGGAVLNGVSWVAGNPGKALRNGLGLYFAPTIITGATEAYKAATDPKARADFMAGAQTFGTNAFDAIFVKHTPWDPDNQPVNSQPSNDQVSSNQ